MIFRSTAFWCEKEYFSFSLYFQIPHVFCFSHQWVGGNYWDPPFHGCKNKTRPRQKQTKVFSICKDGLWSFRAKNSIIQSIDSHSKKIHIWATFTTNLRGLWSLPTVLKAHGTGLMPFSVGQLAGAFHITGTQALLKATLLSGQQLTTVVICTSLNFTFVHREANKTFP